MSNKVINVCVKFNYDQLHLDKALWNFQKCDNNKNNNKKNNIRSRWGT